MTTKLLTFRSNFVVSSNSEEAKVLVATATYFINKVSKVTYSAG